MSRRSIGPWSRRRGCLDSIDADVAPCTLCRRRLRTRRAAVTGRCPLRVREVASIDRACPRLRAVIAALMVPALPELVAPRQMHIRVRSPSIQRLRVAAASASHRATCCSEFIQQLTILQRPKTRGSCRSGCRGRVPRLRRRKSGFIRGDHARSLNDHQLQFGKLADRSGVQGRPLSAMALTISARHNCSVRNRTASRRICIPQTPYRSCWPGLESASGRS